MRPGAGSATMPAMDDPDGLDTAQVDAPPHDRTPDGSLGNALSLRDAANAAGVTEKTIRRWIKGGRLHAVKLGGQYRITLAALERARSTEPGGHLDQGPRLARGQEPSPPRVDARPDTGHGHPGVDLRPVIDHIARLEGEVRQLTEAATVWQVRALQAEEKLKALGAGDGPAQAAPQASPSAPGAAEPAGQGADASVPWWKFWERWER